MSSTRNKRKRPENEPSAVPLASRRRSREQRAVASEVAPSSNAAPSSGNSWKKNEAIESIGNELDGEGDSSTDVAPMNMGSRQDASEFSFTQHTDKEATTKPEDKLGSKSRNMEEPNGKNKTFPESAVSSADAGSSSTDTQDGISSRRQALHISIEETSHTEPPGGDNDRASRIRDLISHRSILLERVRTCKDSAEIRLRDLSSRSQGKRLSDEEEIAAFRTMTKEASLSVKRNRGEGEGNGEKRTSFSLRRGSSVGKRMNAALSSLVPSSNLSSAAISDGQASQSVLNNTNSQSLVAQSKNQTAAAAASMQQKAASLPIAPGTSALIPTSSVTTGLSQSQLLPGHSKLKKASSQYDVPRGRPTSSKVPKVATSAPSGVASSIPLPTSLPRPDLGTYPSQARGPSRGLPSSRLGAQPTKVKFPEAISLRRKREQIQSKLCALLERQEQTRVDRVVASNLSSGIKTTTSPQTRIHGTEEASKGKTTIAASTAPVSSEAVALSKQVDTKKLVRAEAGMEIHPTLALPQRRRTHWDAVLLEMSWLATDFTEERKWKMSTARAIASEISSSKRVFGRMASSAKVTKSTLDPKGASGGTNNMGDVSSYTVEKEQLLRISGNLSEKQDGVSTSKLSSGSKAANGRAACGYVIPHIDDRKESENRGRMMSSMISELNVAIRSGALAEVTNKYHEEALANYYTTRKRILAQGGPFTTRCDGSGEDLASAERDQQKVRITDDHQDDNFQDSTIESITEAIDRLHRIVNTRHKVSAKEYSNALRSSQKINLSASQRDSLEFVEKLWSAKPSCGAAILGAPISGKTFVTATILWKQRGKGPQILICPPRSVIRWRHELDLFANIRVLNFGLTGGIANPSLGGNVSDIDDVDVIICEYACLSLIKGAISKRKIEPHSVVVDLRHPLARLRSFDISSVKIQERGLDFPSEILALDWWDDLIGLMKAKLTRRLLIEYFDEDPFSLSKSGIEHRVQLDVLAKRAACIIGPDVFRSATHSINRQILTWARRQRKKDVPDKSARVRRALSEAIAPMCISVREPFVKAFDFGWELRTCSMTQHQRKDYESCCMEVRGALSSFLVDEWKSASDSINTVPLVSSALLRLRRQCFHPDGHELLHRAFSRNRGGEKSRENPIHLTEQTKDFRDSPAQPNYEVANSLLRKSSKLKELVSILTTEAGYRVDDESFKGLFNSSDTSHEDFDPRKKVAILAVLPEVQQLVSLFLNSLGIQNELMSQNTHSGISVLGNGGELQQKQNGVNWAIQQRVLSRFCDDPNDLADSEPSNSKIVIASPSLLSGWNTGLGIEGADIIISLDDDWTGRGGRMVDSLVRRSLTRSELREKGVELIRLVCANTIETKIFGSGIGADLAVHWPLDSDGFLTLPTSEDEALAFLKSSMEATVSPFPPFPAVSLLRQRDMLLSDVLGTFEPLPKLFGSGTPAKFLPTRNSTDIGIGSVQDEEVMASLRFLQHLMWHEQSASSGNNDERGPSRLVGRSSVWKIESCPSLSLVVGENKFPPAFVTRQDLPTIAAQIVIERISRSQPSSLLDGMKARPVNLSQLTDSTFAFSQHGEVSTKAGMDEKPSTFLFYLPCKSDPGLEKTSSNVDELHGASSGSNEKRRFNAYAKLFSASYDGISVRDGSQGCEPLVFFPPLFPLLQESSKRAKLDSQASKVAIASSRQSEMLLYTDDDSSAAPNMEFMPSSKRKEKETAEDMNGGDLPNSKRARTHRITTHVGNGTIRGETPEGVNNGRTSESPSKKSSPTMTDSTDTHVSPNDVAGSVAMNSLSEPIASTFPPFQNVKDSDLASSAVKDDFGLLGVGAIARPIDSMLFSAHNSGCNGTQLPLCRRYDFVTYPAPCDAEESDPFVFDQIAAGVQSVLLFVKKNPRQLSESKSLHRQPHVLPDTFWKGLRNNDLASPSSLSTAAIPFKAVGSDDTKKGKKRLSQGPLQMPPSAFTRLPVGPGLQMNRGVTQGSLSNSKQSTKGDYRHQVLGSFASRMRTTGLTMFDSLGYKSASIRVERRVSERLERLMWKSTLSSDLGPGVPLQLAELPPLRVSETSLRWTSIVRELGPGASTGDAALSSSTSTLASFRGCLVSPSRVDFGPFGTGFMASPSGMNGVSTPRSRVGISLPMGVKVIKPAREQKPTTWTSTDDKLLQCAVKKFGENWLFVASALGGFEGVVVNATGTSVDRVVPSTGRSARQCRDRWHALARSQPSIMNDVRTSGRLFRDIAFERSIHALTKEGTCEIRKQHGVSFLSTSSLFIESDRADRSQGEVQATPDAVEDATLSLKVDEIDGSLKNAPSLNEESKNDNIGTKAEDVELIDDILPVKIPNLKTRSFFSVSAAKSKRQTIPIAITGVISGSAPNHPVPPHLSHMQSVQASMTAQWASGRTEMWPLQILDLSDKQRSVARVGTSQRPDNSVTNSSSRQAVLNGTGQRSPQGNHPSASSGRAAAPFMVVPTNASRLAPNHHRGPQSAAVAPLRSAPVAPATAQAYLPPQASIAKAKNTETAKSLTGTAPKSG